MVQWTSLNSLLGEVFTARHCMFSPASCHDVSVFVVTLVTVMVMMSSPSSLSLAPPPPAQVSLLADLSPHVTPHSVNVATISD